MNAKKESAQPSSRQVVGYDRQRIATVLQAGRLPWGELINPRHTQSDPACERDQAAEPVRAHGALRNGQPGSKGNNPEQDPHQKVAAAHQKRCTTGMCLASKCCCRAIEYE